MRHTNQLACVYHPTELIFIDDDRTFLNNLSARLEKFYVFKTFSQSEKGLNYLKSHIPTNQVASHISSIKEQFAPEDFPEQLDDNNYRHTYIDLKCIDFYRKIFDKGRFQSNAIVIIDQVMPGVDGLSICKELAASPFKFIMLTGEADAELAITAFNQGIIDHFVKKDSPTFVDQLKDAIKKLQQDYFHEQSHTFMNSLSLSPTCILDDVQYITTFKNYIEKYKIIEYYLLDETGSFLMLQANGTPHWLVATSENEMAENYEFASNEAYNPDNKVLDGLKKRNMMLFRVSEEQRMNVGPNGKDGWLAYMHPAKKIKAEYSDFYYSIFSGKANLYFDGQTVFSYQQFLSEQK